MPGGAFHRPRRPGSSLRSQRSPHRDPICFLRLCGIFVRAASASANAEYEGRLFMLP